MEGKAMTAAARYRICAVCGMRHGPTYGFKTTLRRLGIMAGDKAVPQCVNDLQKKQAEQFALVQEYQELRREKFKRNAE
jgi:hypothetical protein